MSNRAHPKITALSEPHALLQATCSDQQVPLARIPIEPSSNRESIDRTQETIDEYMAKGKRRVLHVVLGDLTVQIGRFAILPKPATLNAVRMTLLKVKSDPKA